MIHHVDLISCFSELKKKIIAKANAVLDLRFGYNQGFNAYHSDSSRLIDILLSLKE
jgi:hypothetical protein